MNRIVCHSDEQIRAEQLPPATRAVGSPARVLFLHGQEVGFATTAENLIHYGGLRANIDAVHVRLVMPRWLRMACKQSPFPVGELDCRYLRHMLFWRMHLRGLLGKGRALPLDRFDVVHITTQQRALIVRDFAKPGANPTGTKFALNIDATLRNWESMRGLRRFLPPIDWAVEGRILRLADLLACATGWVGDSATGQYGVDAKRIVIHKPCARMPSRLAARAANDKLRIIFIGGNWIDKGGPRLLKWHQERWADRAELHIVSGSVPRDVTGRGVVVHGKVPHDRLMGELLPSCDLLVVPTKWDTFMIAAQEAQAAGLPVVTTRTGGVGECVENGVTGFLCDRGDDGQYIGAVDRLLGDGALRARMSAAAVTHAQRDLSPDRWHNHLLDNLVALADGAALRMYPEGLAPAGDRSNGRGGI